MNDLKEILIINEKQLGGPHCTHPNAIITLNVDPKDYDKLNTRQYPIPSTLESFLDIMIKKWEGEKKLGKAATNCQFNSPLLVAPKFDKDGKVCGLRICLDARELNKVLLENDRFEIPRIPDVLQRFSGCSIFGEFDLSEAYFQFPIAPESQKYTAFTHRGQQYVFISCPYGIKHIPSLFQRFMVELFHDLPFVFPYIDNLPFASHTWDEHYQHAYAIIDRLNSVNLRIKPSSINLGNSEIRILGHLINQHGINLDPEKKRVITEWPLPRGGPELAAFLGLGTFLRDHIRHYADITSPLEAVKKHKIIEWNDILKNSFYTLQRAFKTAPFLKYPDLNKRFVIACDASGAGVGGVLYQPNDDNDTITPFNIVGICSKKLTATQRNYVIYKKELWAMIYCLRKFHTYIWGRRDTVVHTDHKPLIHILHQKSLSVSLQQWLDVILGYDLTIKYRPGILHIIPDALSRMYLHSYKNDNEVWGTHTNIHFIESSQQNLSPSDFLCQQSISSIKLPTNLKKKYIDEQESGEGNKRKISSEFTQITTSNNDNQNLSSASTTYLQSSSLTNFYVTINNPNHSQSSDQSDNDYYQFNQDNNNNHRDYTEEYNNENDYDLSIHYGSLCYASTHPYVSPKPFISPLTTPFTYTTQEEIKREVNNNINLNDNMQEERELPSSKDEVNEKFNDNNNIDDHDKTHLLSHDEKMLLAMDKRGVQETPIEVRQELIERAHLMGHQGIRNIYRNLMNRNHWWPYMYHDIEMVVKKCESCLKYTVGKHGYHPMKPVTALFPGDHYMMDIMTMPESSDGLTNLLVLIDVFTSFIMLRVLLDLSAETIARALWEIFCTIGPCKILQHDQAPSFMSSIMRSILNHQGIEQRVISAYHPKADGKVERSIQTVRDIINKMIKGAHELWPLFVPFVQLSYNYRISELTGSSPFSLMFGRNINELIDYTNYPISTKINLNDWQKHQEELISLIFPAITLRSKKVQQKRINMLAKYRRSILERELPPGSQVMILDPKYIKNPHTRPKDEAKYIGPFFIQHRSIHGPYHLRDRAGVMYDRPVNIDQMKIIHRQPMKDEGEDDDVYQMDYIVKDRINNKTGKKEYLIKWTGYPHSQNTWEPEDHITDRRTLKKYQRQKAGIQYSDLSSHLYLISSSSSSSSHIDNEPYEVIHDELYEIINDE